jgi:hypothetical protein
MTMTRDDVLELYATLPGTIEDHPFGENVAMFKVGAITSISSLGSLG